MLKKFTLLLIPLLLLMSCVSTSNIPKSFYNEKTVSKDNVRLIFDRKEKFLFIGVDVLIEVNGQVLTKLSNGSSFYYDLPTDGKTIIKVEGFLSPGKYPLEVDTVKGKIYKFIIEPSMSTKYGSLFKVTQTN
tara:strand:- start:62 stop:457 length:396 start_codon:yes stop_codon:yes gene_type:complete